MKSVPGSAARRRPTSPLARAVGRRIRALRGERGWSQRHLAALLGTTEDEVKEYEIGGALPALRTLLFLGQAFRVSLDSLVLEEPEALLPLEDERLLYHFRQVGMLAPAARTAAADLLDIFLGLHDFLRSPGRLRVPAPRDPAAAILHLEQLTEREREATRAFSDLVLGLRRVVEARTARADRGTVGRPFNPEGGRHGTR